MNTQTPEAVVRIKIVGVGGGGSNAVERMLDAHIPMVEYITINTDDGGYNSSRAETKLQIGKRETRGRGAGADPVKGLRSAEENRKDIEELLKNCDMLFVTAGMGGGTDTGAAPVVAEIARKMRILTVAVVTKPFAFEGKKRMDNALSGIERLEKHVDSMVIIPNDNLKKVSQIKITLCNAFEIADNVLVQTVKNHVELIQNTAFINCDFADIRSVLENSGTMHTATGLASGIDRGTKILEQITSSVLLESSVDNADRILLCISCAEDVALDEIDGINSVLSGMASPNANIIFGMNFDGAMEGAMKVVLIATKRK